MVLHGAQVIIHGAPGTVAEVGLVDHLIVPGHIVGAGDDLVQPYCLGGQGILPEEGGQAGRGVVGDAPEIILDGLAGHDLRISCLFDADIGIEAFICHGSFDDLTGEFQLYLYGGLVQAIKLRGLGLHDLVPAQGQRLGYRHAIFIRPDSIHQFSGPVVVDLEYGVGNGGAGGPAVHGVVVRRGLGDLDLPGDGGVLPLHFCGLPGLDIDGLFLCVRDISLIFQLSQVVAARLQVLNADITPVITGVLSNGGVVAVIEEEGHSIDALSGGAVGLVDQDTGHSLIGDLEGFSLAVHHLKIVRSTVQLESIRSLNFNGIICAIYQRYKSTAVFSGGDSIYQFIVHFPNLKGSPRNTLIFIRGIHLDDLYTSHRVVVEHQGLRIIGIDDHGLAACLLMNGIALDGLGFRHHDGPGNARKNDLAVLIGIIQALAGQGAALCVHIGAVGIGELEFHPLQGLVGHRIQLVDNEIALGLVAELQGNGLSGFDHSSLRRIV